LVIQYCGFPKYMHPYVLDLWNLKVICIQHGLTVQQLAQYQRRIYDNTTLYCLASKYEKQNLMHPVYGYEEDMLKINGLARYDGLKNNDKKVILITPTWRRNVVSQGIAYKKKPYNEHFKHTEYFRLYNTLINDKKLIDCAKKNGYEITYLLHPAMSPQIEDFKDNGFVKIIAASGDMNYEEVLTQSSLMVTDYSGVQFDFAYMRKPIVYYHPSSLPPHYEAGGIDYPTQGFGPICKEHDELVDTVCEFMENNCEAKEEYKLRADDFFAFDDYNNCKRIYEEILNFLEK
ncbi:MAG: CDP-glycerol glycerophosphotransferase family protein, partial [Ruminococcus sp.]